MSYGMHNFRFFADPRRYAELTFGIPGLRIALNPPCDPRSYIYLSDVPYNDRERRLDGHWRKVVLVNIDVFSDEGQKPDALRVPYLMHPLIYERELYKESFDLRRTPRTMRVFFAGNTDPNEYRIREFAFSGCASL